MSKTKELFVALAKSMGINVNAEVAMDKKEMVDLLIKNKAAEESERETLMALSEKSLTLMANAFPPAKGKVAGEEDDPADPADPKAKKPPVAANAVDMNALADLVVEKLGKQAPTLNAEDRAALDAAKAVTANARAATIARIVANSKMTAESLKDMTDAQLQTINAGLQPTTNFSGRGAILTAEEGSDKEELKAMSASSNVTDLIKAKRNGGAA